MPQTVLLRLEADRGFETISDTVGVEFVKTFRRFDQLLDRGGELILISEARQIAGIIGGLTYVPKALPSAEIVLDDLVLEWYTIEPKSVCIGKSIRDLQVRTASGASIVSIIEPDRIKRINPEADTILNEGATLILAGDRRTITNLKRLLVTGKVD